MAIRLVVSDVDGTLVDKNKELTDATVAAVGRLREASVDFTVVSARPRSGVRPLLAPLKLDDVAVAAFNGGWVWRGEETVFHEVVDEAVVRGVLDLAEGSGVDTWVFADDRWHATDGHGPHTDSERVSANQEPTVVASFDGLFDRVDKITFVSDDEDKLRALYERAHGKFGEQATIAQSQVYYLDVTALAGNKGAAVERLSEALGIDLADTAVIGDQANDLPMLERAGLAIAMGNAPERVKSAADDVTLANDADGVAHAIDTIILPRHGDH